MENEGRDPRYAGFLSRLVRVTPNYDFNFIKPLRQLAVDGLRLQKGSRVLDVGCGMGGTFPYLVEAVGQTGQVVGVEISPESATNARRRIAANRWSNVQVLEEDARTVVLDGMFDGMVMFAAPDIYASPQALENLLPYMMDNARVALFGPKLTRRRFAEMLNWVFRALMKLSFSSTPLLNYEPWHLLEEKGAVLEVKEYFSGCMFLAWGGLDRTVEVQGVTDRQFRIPL